MRCASGYMRHWFTWRGGAGDYMTTCWRCGAVNPRCTALNPRHLTAAGRWSSPICGRKTNDTGYCADHQERDV